MASQVYRVRLAANHRYIVTTGQCTVTVLKFQTLLVRQKGMYTCTNSADPDQTASEEASLIRVFPVCYYDKHFVSSSLDYQYVIGEQIKNVYEIL